MVTLGCARNEVDSEELAARLEAGGWQLAGESEDAAVVLVNTCGFIQAAKQESIDVLLDATTGGARVVAAGCLAERYGSGLGEAMPEAQILGFDDYEDIAARLDAVAAGEHWPAHEPRDRRTLLPLAPADRPGSTVHLPGHGLAAAGGSDRHEGDRPASDPVPDLPPGIAPASGPRVMRRRLGGSPVAPLKIASGCDRRCTFCAIPAFRGAFVSRRPADLVAEAGRARSPRAAARERELHLVRQGSRRPQAARVAAPAARRGAGDQPGSGELPAASRSAARARRGAGGHAGCGQVLRPVVPARQRPRAAVDAE